VTPDAILAGALISQEPEAMTWPIHPGSGLGFLRFGMSPAEVAQLPGMPPVRHIVPGGDGSVRASRGVGFPLFIHEDDRLTGIDTTRRVSGVTFESLDVYADPPGEVLMAFLVAELSAGGTGARLLLDVVHFPALGVACSGFWYPETGQIHLPGLDEDTRGLALNQPGAFASFTDQMVPINLFAP
jgi:hypothetical protein